MQRPTFDELFLMLSAMVSEATLSATDLARLRDYITSIARIADSTGCLALIEQSAQGRPCPHCHC